MANEVTINRPDVVAELQTMHEGYEKALMENDIASLTAYFWDSEDAVRFGVAECLYGAKEIEAFRVNRGAVNLSREVRHLKIVAFGEDTGMVTLEFHPKSSYGVRRGRQSQCWRKFATGWKIVSAHVSVVPEEYSDQAGKLAGLPIPADLKKGVSQNIERAAVIAQPLLELTFEPSLETVTVFEP